MAPVGLSLYQFGQRRSGSDGTAWPARPPGRLICLVATGADEGQRLIQLARYIRDDDGHPVLICSDAEVPGVTADIASVRLPPDRLADVDAWLSHWQPDVILFAGPVMRPTLIHSAAARKIPMALAEAGAPQLPAGRNGWYPGLLKSSLAHMHEVLAIDETAAGSLRKLTDPAKLSVAGRMEQPSAVLHASEAEREALAGVLNTRPVWLAVALPEAEEAAVIEAHRAGLGLAHRLLLIIVPDDPSRAAALSARIEVNQGWAVAQRALDEEPEPGTEVFIADAQEMGLWYRLAPICFFGGSLAGTGCHRNPMEAAALGSSVIHGPRPGAWGAVLGRLGAARAARSVGSGRDLAEALGELLSPDRAAHLARAAWGVASEGVDVTLRVQALLRRMLGED